MFKKLVKQNRSYRNFDNSYVVTKEQLLEMVDCARLAPASVNVQPFKYFLAYQKEIVNRIQPLTGWARALPDITLPHPGKEPTAFIVICQDLSISEAISRYQKDVGIVAQTILLQATHMGLGGCMIGNYNPDKVKEALQLAENFTPVLIIAIGKVDEVVNLLDMNEGEPTNYYRDENDVHYVPKRKLEDIIL